MPIDVAFDILDTPADAAAFGQPPISNFAKNILERYHSPQPKSAFEQALIILK